MVIESVHLAGISTKVARTVPLGVVKGGGGERKGKRRRPQKGRQQHRRQR